MITAQIDAAPAIAKLGALPMKLRVAVREAVEEDAQELLAIVQAKLSGEVLQLRTGALLRSITVETNEDADGIGARVLSDGSVPYARIQEFGGRIAIPEIAPATAKALAFNYAGRLAFAKRTAAHVVDLPERSYMRSSLAEFAPGFVGRLREAFAETIA